MRYSFPDYRRPPPPRAFGPTFGVIAVAALVGCVCVSVSLAFPAVLAAVGCIFCVMLD